MASLGINKKSEERASSKNHLRTTETGDTLTPGLLQTEEKILFLSGIILRWRRTDPEIIILPRALLRFCDF